MKTEKELKSDKFTEEYEKMNYEENIVNKEELKRKREEELRKQIEEETERRSKIVEGKITKNEMLMIEKEIGRYVDWKTFDSEINKWNKDNSDFGISILNKSHLIIVIETTEGNKFGCYIESLIKEENKYISDSNAFIFKLDNDSIEKYSIVENKNAIKIFREKK